MELWSYYISRSFDFILDMLQYDKYTLSTPPREFTCMLISFNIIEIDKTYQVVTK